MSRSVSCQKSDKIKCTDCGQVNLVDGLVAQKGKPFERTDGVAALWQPVFYFCHCDLKHPKVHDPGDGNLVLVYLSHAEIIK